MTDGRIFFYCTLQKYTIKQSAPPSPPSSSRSLLDFLRHYIRPPLFFHHLFCIIYLVFAFLFFSSFNAKILMFCFCSMWLEPFILYFLKNSFLMKISSKCWILTSQRKHFNFYCGPYLNFHIPEATDPLWQQLPLWHPYITNLLLSFFSGGITHMHLIKLTCVVMLFLWPSQRPPEGRDREWLP